MKAIKKNVNFRIKPGSNTSIPQKSSISKLALSVRNRELTNCLELLADRGLRGDTAIFILSNFSDLMEAEK